MPHVDGQYQHITDYINRVNNRAETFSKLRSLQPKQPVHAAAPKPPPYQKPTSFGQIMKGGK